MVDAEPGRSREPGRAGQYEPAPRWVKVLLVVGGLLVVGFLVMLLSGGGHGPGRHTGLPAAARAAASP